MANLRFRLTIIAVGLMLIALALGLLTPGLISLLHDEASTVHLLAATFVFVGLCGAAFYALMERALDPVTRLIDTFMRMRAGDLNPRLPVEGPEEMRRMARGFNDMLEDLEMQIRDSEVGRQSAERERHVLEGALATSERFRWTIDAAPFGIVVTDASIHVVYQNPASDSGFRQLASFGDIGSSIVGEPISSLYPEPDQVAPILADPDRLPHEMDVTIGPHRLHFTANAVFDEDEEFAGIVMMWEEVETLELVVEDEPKPELSEDFVESLEDEFDFNEGLEPVDPDSGIGEEILAEVEDLENEAVEMIGEDLDAVESDALELAEEESDPVENGILRGDTAVPYEVRRTANLVKRSVGVLADRLKAVSTTVDALCDEGDSLRKTIEEISDQAEATRQLIDERAEPLQDLLDHQKRASMQRQEAANLVKVLKSSLSEAAEMDRSMDQLRGSIEHLVVSSKVEISRMGEDTGGIRVVIDAIGDLGDEARRVGESTHVCIRELAERVDEVIDLAREQGDVSGLVERLESRAATALSRIERTQNESSERDELLKEMARGQAEIAKHIANQIKELSDLVTLTSKVAIEQVETVGGD
ncbi:MAG TPA: hypothetical protein DHW45_11125 [Candidatus Latescibacteria bacterium]|nr:hypothetical protein [Candidatus Latescibacterota bacterium]